MFCYQCQETGNGKGCTAGGACGKTDETANLQDLLIYTLRGIAFIADRIFNANRHSDTELKRKTGVMIAESLFATITNTNFDPDRIAGFIESALSQREALKAVYLKYYKDLSGLPESAKWSASGVAEIVSKSYSLSVLEFSDPDLRSVKETITYGLKGLSAYAYHAAIMGFYDDSIFDFIFAALAKTDNSAPMEGLLEFVLETGHCNLKAMAVLDKANNETYGSPEPTSIESKVGSRPGILVSGHDLHDLDLILRQSEGSGVDIFTNGEMILAQSMPYFKKFRHFSSHYGNAWWQQNNEFASFNGPIVVTSNCIIPVEDAYKDRIYTSSVAGYPGVPHIGAKNGEKDFSAVIEQAKKLKAPAPLNDAPFMSGFGHNTLMSVKDKVIALVKAGKIKRFVAMGGCDGRDPRRSYYTEKALSLPQDTVILTAGCAKFRYIRLVKGDIDGIPRVLDAGQCSDNYSFLVFALELAKSLGINDINELPVEFDIAWYDQKAVAVLLTLVYLGVKKIKLGPTLPEFLTQYLVGKLKDRVEVTTVC